MNAERAQDVADVRSDGRDGHAERGGDLTGVLAVAEQLEDLPLSRRQLLQLPRGRSRRVGRLRAEDDGLDTIVVGLPSRLDGTPTDATPAVVAFIDALKTRTMMPVATEGERLTSHEADQRLAATERDWRKRKRALDAAAAAIILQDYLDRTGTRD